MSPEVALFIDPVSHHFEGDRLFDRDDPDLNRDGAIAVYAHLRSWFAQRGVPVHTADRLEAGEVVAPKNVYVSMGIRNRWPQLAGRGDVIPSAFFALECPIVEPTLYRDLPQVQRRFRRVYSFSHADALEQFVGGRVDLLAYRIPYHRSEVDEELWARTDRKPVVMINRNKQPRLKTDELYTERLRAVQAFQRTGDIDLYGQGWDDVPSQMGWTSLPYTVRRMALAARRVAHRLRPDPLLVAARRAWRGAIDAKLPVLADYRFAICFENMALAGYVTEKLFDCLVAGTVPVYLGAPDIADHVPPDCFVDMREFAGYEELREYLRALDETDLRGFRDRGRRFLGSRRFHPFSQDALVETFAAIVEQDTGASLAGSDPGSPSPV